MQLSNRSILPPMSSARSLSQGARTHREYAGMILRSEQMSRTLTPATTALEADIESLTLKYNLIYDKTMSARKRFADFLQDANDFKAEARQKLSVTQESLTNTEEELSTWLRSLGEELQQEVDAEAAHRRFLWRRVGLLSKQASDITDTLRDCWGRVRGLEEHCGTQVLGP